MNSDVRAMFSALADAFGVDFDTLAYEVAQRVAARGARMRLTAPHRYGPNLYTVAELAERYSMSKTAIRNRVKAGEFGEIVKIGKRCYCVTAASVAHYEATHTVQTPPRPSQARPP